MKVLNKPIEVISTFSEKGEVTPIRFRLSAEDGELQVIQIKRIILKEKLKLAGEMYWKFDCEVVVNEQIKLCEIRYFLLNCKWSVYKI